MALLLTLSAVAHAASGVTNLMQTELVISKTIRRTGVPQEESTCSASGCDDLEEDDTLHFMQNDAMLGKSQRYIDLDDEDEDSLDDDFSLIGLSTTVNKKQKKDSTGPRHDEQRLMQMGIQVKTVPSRRTGAAPIVEESSDTCLGMDCDSDEVEDSMHFMQGGASIGKGLRQHLPVDDEEMEGMDDEFAMAQTDVEVRKRREEELKKNSRDAEMFFEEDPGAASLVQATLVVRRGDVPSDPTLMGHGADFVSQPRVDEETMTSLFQTTLTVNSGEADDEDASAFGGFQLKRRDTGAAAGSCAAGARGCNPEASFDDFDSFSL